MSLNERLGSDVVKNVTEIDGVLRKFAFVEHELNASDVLHPPENSYSHWA